MCQEISFIVKNSNIFINQNLASAAEAYKMAAKYNRLDVINNISKYKDNTFNDYIVYESMLLAAEHGHLPIIQKFLDNNEECIYNVKPAIVLSERNNHTKVAQYLKQYSDYINEKYSAIIRQLEVAY